MADSNILVLQADGTTKTIDSRTESTNLENRQVIVIGDPSANSSVAEVRSTDPDSTSQGVVVRDVNASAIVAKLTSGIAVSGISTSIGVYFDRGEPVVRAYGLDGATSRAFKMNSDGAIKIYDIANGTVSVTGSVVNTSSTAVIPGTVSGSTSGVSVSGVTLVAPESNHNIKVYAISLTTTAQVHLTAKFTNGSGTSPTEFWRYALQAPTSGISGANLAVSPPGYLFATGVNTTLSLVLASASLVHYSIAYFKESA